MRRTDQSISNGAAQPNLAANSLKKFEIPLPPLDEQRRIAAILGKADGLRRKRKRVADLSVELASSLFDSFYQTHRNSWSEIQFVDLALRGSGNFGNGPFGSDLLTSELTTQGVPVVYIRDIVTEEYKRVSRSFVTEQKAAQLRSCNVKGGDLLITKVGDPPGIASVYPLDEPDAIMTQDVIRLRTNPTLVIPEYLAYFLNSSTGRHLISGITVAATRARFSLRDLKKLMISLPPLETQRSFQSSLRTLNGVRDTQATSRSAVEHLFSSLQSRAFSGQL